MSSWLCLSGPPSWEPTAPEEAQTSPPRETRWGGTKAPQPPLTTINQEWVNIPGVLGPWASILLAQVLDIRKQRKAPFLPCSVPCPKPRPIALLNFGTVGYVVIVTEISNFIFLWATTVYSFAYFLCLPEREWEHLEGRDLCLFSPESQYLDKYLAPSGHLVNTCWTNESLLIKENCSVL